MTLAPGTRIGPYELVGQIGAGGMGDHGGGSPGGSPTMATSTSSPSH